MQARTGAGVISCFRLLMREAAAAGRPYGVHIRPYQHPVPLTRLPSGAACSAGETCERGRGDVSRLYLVRPVRRSKPVGLLDGRILCCFRNKAMFVEKRQFFIPSSV